MKPREPARPAERQETVRREMAVLLERGQFTARDISGEIRIPEKDVYAHLAHIQKSMGKKGRRLSMTPPECRKCGFVFKKRERLTRPGKCPICKGTSVQEPLFSIG
jgi:predicted Zn-ribbon and HTH transcriptional regulator